MFEDFNFKLVVINSLLNTNYSFRKDLDYLREKYINYNEDKPIKEILSFLENLILKDSDLFMVNSLSFDGGNDIYFIIYPNWDGTNADFDVKSINGFKCLKNLKEVEYVSMCNESLLKPLKEYNICIV